MRNIKKIIAVSLVVVLLAGCSNKVPADGNTNNADAGTIDETSPIIEFKPIVSACEPIVISAQENRLVQGQAKWINVTVTPRNAYGGFSYSSSDETVATVSEKGLINAINPGKAEITITASNGVAGKCGVTVLARDANLTFELSSDSVGYTITGCDKDVYMVNIPATYNGLPVIDIAGEAFIECHNLRFFTVDPEQEFFYTEDGVLFTDIPVKTLVKMPNRLLDENTLVGSYAAPADTRAIGDYAFAGLSYRFYGCSIHFPEGVTTIGNKVFDRMITSINVYVPRSVTSVGEDFGEIPEEYGISWFTYAGCYFRGIAVERDLPFREINDFEPRETNAVTFIPRYKENKEYKKPEDDQVDVITEIRYTERDERTLRYFKDLSEQQLFERKEIRLMLEGYYYDLIPDKEGKVRSIFPAITGLYGMGCTEEPTTLVGYDINGDITETQVVTGNFMFCLRNAVNLGISGGKGTKITVVPYEPTFVATEGYVGLDPEKWTFFPEELV